MKRMSKGNDLDSNKTIYLALPYISTIFFFPWRRGKNTRPDNALVWTQHISSYSGSRAQMNMNLVPTSAVTLASYGQDLGKVALAHTSKVRPCGHFSRQDRVLCFLQAVAQKPALGENYRGPDQKHRLPDLMKMHQIRGEGKQSLAKYKYFFQMKQ